MSSSAAETNAKAEACCGNCGIAEVDQIKLTNCNFCDLVQYCSVKCQEEHRQQHEEECKKRAAALHDEILFRQPESSYLGDCPLCFLPLSLDHSKSAFYSCCSNVICDGCVYTNYISNKNDRVKAHSCPFCRTLGARDDEEEHRRRAMKRVEADDPAALRQMGGVHLREGDYVKAAEYWTKAAELGDLEAHYCLGDAFREGEGVEKDEKKMVYHFEVAAVGGHAGARHNLGCYEERSGNIDRAVKHFIISANHGDDDSMKTLWKVYAKGKITKEALEATLRTHKAAIDATKSPQREAAEKFHRQAA